MLAWYHYVWMLLPLFFILLALWAKLEQMSGRQRKDNPGDLVNQALFVTGCVIVCILVDKYLLVSFYEALLPAWVPLGLIQFLLLPAVLLVAAKFLGPSEEIRITKSPRPTRSKGRDHQ